MDEKKAKLIRFSVLCALIFWQLNLLSTYVQHYQEGQQFAWRSDKDVVQTADFLRFYVAGEMARSVDGNRVYVIPAHFPYMNKLTAPLEVTTESSLSFPPSVFALMSVLSYLPLVPAYLLFVVGSLAFAGLGLFCLLRRARGFSMVDSAIIYLATVNSLSAATCLRTGQWSLWLVGAFCLFFWASMKKEGRQALSGIFLGLLFVKPQFVLPLFVLTAVQKRWVAAGVCGFGRRRDEHCRCLSDRIRYRVALSSDGGRARKAQERRCFWYFSCVSPRAVFEHIARHRIRNHHQLILDFSDRISIVFHFVERLFGARDEMELGDRDSGRADICAFDVRV